MKNEIKQIEIKKTQRGFDYGEFTDRYKFVARKPDVLALRMNGNKLAVTVNSI